MSRCIVFVEVPRLWVEHPPEHARPRVFVELPAGAAQPSGRATLRIRHPGTRPVNVHLRRPEPAVVTAGPAWEGRELFDLDLRRPGLFEAVPVNDGQGEKLFDVVGELT